MHDYPCSIKGCDRRHKARLMCTMHYQRAMRRARGIPPLPPIRLCDTEGCERVHHANGLCNACRRRALRAAGRVAA